MSPPAPSPRRRARPDASSLVVVMVLIAVLSMVCASVLETVTQEYLMSRNTLAWNQALYTAESGIERGWNEMNKLTGVNTATDFMATTNGWVYLGTNTWARTNRALIPLMGVESNTVYSVWVRTNWPAGSVTITATGTAYAPRTGRAITRNVEVVLAPTTPFKWAMLAKGLIDFNGNAAYVDSFNSTNGGYVSTSRRAHGNIGTDGSLIDAAGLDLYGSAQTGPGGVVTTGPGFLQFQPTAPDTGTNTISDGLRVSIPDSKLPSGIASLSSLGSINNNYTITAAGLTQVKATEVSLNGGKTLTISGSGKVQIYLTGQLGIGGSSSIILAPSSPGALSVEFYVGGAVDLNGNGIVNPGSAPNLAIYGLSTCSAVGINGTADFMGAIYAPQATFTLAGGARVDGAIVGNNINATGTLDFHYDEALSNFGNVTYYSLTRWREY
jgi:Tfp pilus assembly protein PilX